MTRIMQWACILCDTFGFFWLWWILKSLVTIETSLPLVLLGIGIYASTFVSLRRPWHSVVLWSLAVVWSMYVFLLIGTSLHAPSAQNTIPYWMQAAAPYVYAASPFLIIWIIRSVVPIYWKKDT